MTYSRIISKSTIYRLLPHLASTIPTKPPIDTQLCHRDYSQTKLINEAQTCYAISSVQILERANNGFNSGKPSPSSLCFSLALDSVWSKS